jgi:cell division septation protein DedD
MGLTKNRYIAGVLLAALFTGGGLYAQNIVPGQLGTEIQAIEQKLIPTASPAERHDALVRLAKLRQLSGNIAEAAANWLDAAAADPQDDAALVSGAYCLAAIGEWEKAALVIRPLLTSGRTGPAILQGWFLDACLRAWSAGDAFALASLAAHPDFAAMRPLIYYTLWQTLTRNPGVAGGAAATNNAESWKSRLLSEFPQSPESRAANPGNEKDSPVVSAVQSPLWQLLPGKAAAATAASPSVATTKPAAPASAAPAPAVPAASAPTVPAPPPSAATSPALSAVVLQTGLFSKEANARAQSEALQKAGFAALISRKLVNGMEHWAVTVPEGQDQRKTIADLKKAGFDSFPVK